MKQTVFFLLIIMCLSCTSTNYTFENPSQTGVDFTQGRWLINELNVPSYLTQTLTARAKKDFTEYLGDRVKYVPEVPGLLIPQKEITLNPSKAMLVNLYKGTGYDYFINIKARERKNDFGPIDLTNHRQKTGSLYKSAEITLEIYDLKNSFITYSQTVVASVKQMETRDVNLSKNQYLMILGGYNRLLNDIKRKSNLQ